MSPKKKERNKHTTKKHYQAIKLRSLCIQAQVLVYTHTLYTFHLKRLSKS